MELIASAIVIPEPHASLAVDDYSLSGGLGGYVVVDMSGRFDCAAGSQLAHAVRRVLAHRPCLVIVTLSRIWRADPRSLTDSLLSAAHTIALRDGRLRVVAAPGRPAFRAITDTGITDRVALHRSLDAALTPPW